MASISGQYNQSQGNKQPDVPKRNHEVCEKDAFKAREATSFQRASDRR